uniref:Uncharacterized protein n=1 Tax=viral metagenome TaxID=1070528 RepID=A0A6M3XUJ2_9ZZZZ
MGGYECQGETSDLYQDPMKRPRRDDNGSTGTLGPEPSNKAGSGAPVKNAG